MENETTVPDVEPGGVAPLPSPQHQPQQQGPAAAAAAFDPASPPGHPRAGPRRRRRGRGRRKQSASAAAPTTLPPPPREPGPGPVLLRLFPPGGAFGGPPLPLHVLISGLTYDHFLRTGTPPPRLVYPGTPPSLP